VLTLAIDDGIVVGEVKKGVALMPQSTRALREKLGDEGMFDLNATINDQVRRVQDAMVEIASERFERRLSQEIAAVRVDMAREFAAVRADVARESAETRVTLLKWSFLFWIGQFAANVSIATYLLHVR
jgi:hypothetical protein